MGTHCYWVSTTLLHDFENQVVPQVIPSGSQVEQSYQAHPVLVKIKSSLKWMQQPWCFLLDLPLPGQWLIYTGVDQGGSHTPLAGRLETLGKEHWTSHPSCSCWGASIFPVFPFPNLSSWMVTPPGFYWWPNWRVSDAQKFLLVDSLESDGSYWTEASCSFCILSFLTGGAWWKISSLWDAQ